MKGAAGTTTAGPQATGAGDTMAPAGTTVGGPQPPPVSATGIGAPGGGPDWYWGIEDDVGANEIAKSEIVLSAAAQDEKQSRREWCQPSGHGMWARDRGFTHNLGSDWLRNAERLCSLWTFKEILTRPAL